MRVLKVLAGLAVTLMLQCQSPDKKKNDNAPRQPETNATTGLVDGNGAEIRVRTNFELPNKPAVTSFLQKIEPAEVVWSTLLAVGLSDSDRAPTFAAADSTCFLSESPTVEVRAYYNRITNMIVLCKQFHDGDEIERLVIVLHELTHFVLFESRINLGDGEEDVVQLFETAYRNIHLASDSDQFKESILALRDLIDRHAAKVEGKAAEIESEKFLGNYKAVAIQVGSDTAFPIPENFFSADYIAPHFLDLAVNTHWTQNTTLQAEMLVTLPAQKELPDHTELASRNFSYSNYSTAKSTHVVYETVESLEGECNSVECTPKLTVTALGRDSLTEEFKKFVDSPNYPGWIRTVDRRVDKNGVAVRRDRVFYVRP